MKKKALAVVLTLMMVVSILPMAAFAADFSDVSADFWARDAINRWTDEGILQGVGDNKFAPNDTLTRAQAAAIFTRLLQLTDAADVSNFTDVEADSWYAPYVACAVAAGIMNGTSATTFNPNGIITRQDFFLILARAVGIKEQSTCNYTQFNDLNQLSGYARGSVYALINLDYVHGRSATELAPLAPITRASAAQVLDNVIQYYITEDGSYDVSGNGVALILAKNVALNGNFNGTVVGSAEDSVVDLTGVTQPVTAIANKGNVKFVNAQPQSAVYSNAPGTEVNGTPVTEDSGYIVPGETPVNPPAGGNTSGGSGGGGEEGKTTPFYDVTLSVRLGNFTAQPIVLSASYNAENNDANTSIDTVFAALASSLTVDKVNEMLNKFSGTQTYNGYTVDITNGVITITQNGAPIDYDEFLYELDQTFSLQSDAAINAVTANGTVIDAWNTFTATFAPGQQIHVVNGELQLWDAQHYVNQAMLAAQYGAEFRRAALQADSSFDFAALIGANGIMSLNEGATVSTFLKQDTVAKLYAAAANAGKTSVVLLNKDASTLDKTAQGFTSFMRDIVKPICVADYTDPYVPALAAAEAVWYAGFMDNSDAMQGLFNVTFSIARNQRSA